MNPEISVWRKRAALKSGFAPNFGCLRARSDPSEVCLFIGPHVPVVAVDVVQPAALLDDQHGARDVLPGGEAVPPLVLLSRGAGFNPAAVGAVLLPAGVVVGALLCLGAPQNGTWTGRTHLGQGWGLSHKKPGVNPQLC